MRTAIARAATAALFGPFAAPPAALAFCQNAADSWCHDRITRQALPFLRPWVLRELAARADDPDDLPLIDQRSAHHFDDCDFNDGAAHINNRYGHAEPRYGAVSALKPLRRFDSLGGTFPLPVDYPLILDGLSAWAFALHAAQDFYSHSNWIEMGLLTAPKIVDRRLGTWRAMSADWGSVRGDLGDGYGNILSAQAPLPLGWSLSYPGHPYVPIVLDAAGKLHHLLISGEAGPFSSCPAGARISHTQLNKDDVIPDSGSLQSPTTHVQAAAMAVHQTRHEWCRLQRLAFDDSGVAGVGVLMGLLADPRKVPHPAESVCSALPPGPVEVTVRVSSVRVLRDKESDGPGQVNLVLSTFSENLRRSRAAQALPVSVNAGALVPSSQLPAAVSLCMNASDRLVATVQGWEDDGSTERGELSASDDLLGGATVAFGAVSSLPSPPLVRTVTRRSDNPYAPDLEVTFRVSRSSPAAPAPGCIVQAPTGDGEAN